MLCTRLSLPASLPLPFPYPAGTVPKCAKAAKYVLLQHIFITALAQPAIPLKSPSLAPRGLPLCVLPCLPVWRMCVERLCADTVVMVCLMDMMVLSESILTGQMHHDSVFDRVSQADRTVHTILIHVNSERCDPREAEMPLLSIT